MKQIEQHFFSKSIIISVFILFLFMMSCSKDEDDPQQTVANKPSVTLLNPDTNYINCNSSGQLELDVVAHSNLTSGKELKSFSITSKFGSEAMVTVLDSTISGVEFILAGYPVYIHSGTGIETWTIRVTDTDNQFQEIKLTLNITYYPPPSLSFLSGEYEPGHDRVDGDVTLTVGTPFVFGIAGSTNSDKDLKRLLIERNYENVSTLVVLDSTFSVSAISFDIQVFSYPNAGSENFECTLWDKNDNSTTISFTVTTEAAAPDITLYTEIILGAQTNNQDGNFFSPVDGIVYHLAEAKLNYDKIDFLYYYGATNHATLAAPDDADAGTIYNNAVNGLQTWTDLNSTRFKVTTLSSTDFNAITTANQIIISATLPTAPTSSDATDLTVGDVLAYKTADQNYGLIRIDAIVTTGDFQSIEITVKKI